MQQPSATVPPGGGVIGGANADLPSHSENVDIELQLVSLALEAIYAANTTFAPATNGHSTQREENLHHRDKADAFLTQFQRLPVAWVVCDRLLALPTNGANSTDANAAMTLTQRRFFAAQTLHSKCRTEIHQLPPDTLPSLRDSLLQHFSNCALLSTGGEKALITRLGMAVCALSVQMNWTSIIPDVMNNLLVPRPELARAILELFKLLPEECSSDRLVLADESLRNQFHDMLRDQASHIWNFCSSALKENNVSLQTQENVLQCLQSWLRYVPANPAMIESSPLLPWIFHSLSNSNNDLYELAVDVVIEIVRMYPSDYESNVGLIQKVIPLVMALGQPDSSENVPKSPFQNALTAQDEDGLRGYCRIFTEMGESYMSLIMSPEELNQITLVELVLVCSGIPDREIANITLHFWYNFVAWLEDLEPYRYRQTRIDHYTPQIIRLLSICTTLLCYPTDIDTLTADRVDDVQRDRYYVSETVEDCCRLLGGDAVLRKIGDHLREECNRVASLPSQEQQLNDWHGIEACLFAIKSLSRYIPNDENVVMPYVMNLIPQLPPAVPLLRCTANLTVGKYASWLGMHPNYLQPLLPYLAQGLSIEQCASASAIAIKELCEQCNEQLMLGDSVLELYGGIVASQQSQMAGANGAGTGGAATPTLALCDELEVLEGACKAVSRQLQDAAAKGTSSDVTSVYLNRLIQPIGLRLTALAAPESTCGPKQVIAELERLTVIVRFLVIPGQGSGGGDNSATSGPGPSFILDLMRESWPLLDAISQKHQRDYYVAEKLCRLHKHALRGAGTVAYTSMLEPLLTQLTRNFAQSHLSPYLYAASICISEYGTDPAQVQRLFGMVSEMSNTVFSMLRTMDDFTSHPDIVEEFFFLAGRMMCKCPEPLVLSPLLVGLLQCAAVGMQLQHRDANRGTLNFLENTVSYGVSVVKSAKAGGSSSTGYSDNSCKEALERAIVSDGQPIVNNLAKALLGDLPAYRLDYGNGSIAGVLHRLNDLCPELLLQWINPALTLVPESAKAAFVGTLVQKVSRDEFNSSVRRFVSICERNRKLGGGTSES